MNDFKKCPKCKRTHPTKVDAHDGGICQWCKNGIVVGKTKKKR